MCTAVYRCVKKLGGGHRCCVLFSDVQRCVVRLGIAQGCSIMFSILTVCVCALLFSIVPFYSVARSLFDSHCHSERARGILSHAVQDCSLCISADNCSPMLCGAVSVVQYSVLFNAVQDGKGDVRSF